METQGISEAGFFPGVVYYLTFWFKSEERSLRIALFFSSAAIAGIIGGILSYLLLQLDGDGGLMGWQWLFIAEGAPTVLAGFTVFFLLPNSPNEVKWLTDEEKKFAIDRLKTPSAAGEDDHHSISWSELKGTFTDWRVILTGLAYFTTLTPFYGVSFFLPSIINELGFDTITSNLLTAPIYGTTLLVTLLNAMHSDAKKERAFHIMVPGFISMVAFILVGLGEAVHESVEYQYFTVTLATAAVWTMVAPTLAWISENLKGSTSNAVGTAFVVALGNLGGVVGPQLFAWDSSGGSYVCAALLLLGIMLIAALRVLTNRYSEKLKINLKLISKSHVTIENKDEENKESVPLETITLETEKDSDNRKPNEEFIPLEEKTENENETRI